MKFRMVAVLLFGVSLVVGCGEETDISSNLEEGDREDRVAFVAPGSDTVFHMNIDGTDVTQRAGTADLPKVWPNQRRLLNGACGGRSTIGADAGPDDQGDPIELVSPDGATLGPLDDSWRPVWSPEGDWVAVACGRTDDGTVVVVSDVERPGSRDGWSRNGRGTLSDQIEVWLFREDGSAVTRLTFNQGGDWLPRWHKDSYRVLVESNRDGNSEIYLESVISTDSYRITERDADDQTPVWSMSGDLIAYTSNAGGQFELYIAEFIGESGELNLRPSTSQAGRPVPWQD